MSAKPVGPTGQRRRGLARRRPRGPVGSAGRQKPLYRADDSGDGVHLSPRLFGGSDVEGWGPAFESFQRLNEPAFKSLALTPRFESTPRGPQLMLYPGAHVGAVPLRSGTTGHVVGGFVVRPRFGWSGVGSILTHIGWHAAPDILSMPLVPGSGREVPPWVLPGPVLARLRKLLDALKRGFDLRTDTLRAPRGTIQWSRYIRQSIPTGRWHHVPSRFPDLSSDPLLRGAVRWTLERVLQELVLVGGEDRITTDLERDAHRLLDRVHDVPCVYPRPELIRRMAGSDSLLEETLRSGLDAIGWVRDERGLGGGRQMDGLAWSMALDRLWEYHVEAHVRNEVRRSGGILRAGRMGETLTPLHWSDPSHRSIGHLVPDIVVTRGETVWIIDAKYKSHFAEIDENGWRRMADEIRASHRADLHQVLAYSALFETKEIKATLAYPLRHTTWRALKARGLDRSTADVYQGMRHLVVELWALPFSADGEQSHVELSAPM
jgi:McrBC 5-methylcytosine restriction system component